MKKLSFAIICVLILTGCIQQKESKTSSNGPNENDLIVAEEKTLEPEKKALPSDVDWVTYSDKDITFTYPKTFLGTSFEQNFDKNLRGEQWEVVREKNSIYIKPNFESPSAEFGSTYEIRILEDMWSAEEEWQSAAEINEGPESQWGQPLETETEDYYVGILKDINMGLGRIVDVYSLVPGGIDTLGKSKNPNQKHFIIYAASGIYQSFVEDILIPSIEAN
ncbi:hypothetical protein GF366_03250 [Candidatus Peregrinibacteria bacterium]|nr:hypothetical protein [Candidatus Peregrinibacteria bacterium]